MGIQLDFHHHRFDIYGHVIQILTTIELTCIGIRSYSHHNGFDIYGYSI